MKKLLFVFIFLFGCNCLVRSESPSRKFPRPDSWVREAVYISSNSPSGTTNVTVTTQPACDLGGISVNTPGTSSTVELYDGRVSTTAVGIRKLGKFDTTSKIFFPFTVGISSGILIHNTGNPPADISILYREHDFR